MTLDEQKSHLSAAFDDGAERELMFKPMFGGACAYVNGRVFASMSHVGLALKIDGETAKVWLAEGAEWVQYMPDKPVSKSYLVVPDAVLKDEEELARWVELSVAWVMTLPLPKSRTKKRV